MAFGARLGAWLPWLWPHERRRSIENLERVCGPLPEPIRGILPGALGSRLGRNLGAMAHALSCGGAIPLAAQGCELLDSACASGRGAVLISAHCGPWEALPNAIAAAGYRAGLVVRPLRDPALDAMVRDRRASGGVRLFVRGEDPLTEWVDWVRLGGVLGIVLDQAPRGRSTEATWWGRPAQTAVGPAWLAAKAGVPLLVATVAWVASSRPQAELRIEGPVPLRGPAGPDLRRATRIATRLLDAQVRRAPLDWVWFHDRWDARA